jgi:hypothetical protein
MRLPAELEAQILAMPGVTVNGAAPVASQPVADTVSEETFQLTVTGLATRNGWKWYHPTISRKSKEGYPDLTLARGNRAIFAELKSESGERTADQLAWADVLEGIGGNVAYFCWKPSDWHEIVEVLR